MPLGLYLLHQALTNEVVPTILVHSVSDLRASLLAASLPPVASWLLKVALALVLNLMLALSKCCLRGLTTATRLLPLSFAFRSCDDAALLLIISSKVILSRISRY